MPAGPGTGTPSPAQGSKPAVTLEDGQQAVGSQVALGVVAELQSLGGAPAPTARTLLGRLRHASGRGWGWGWCRGFSISISTARVSLAAEVGAGGLKGRVLYAVSLHTGTGCEQRRGATLSLNTGGEGRKEGGAAPGLAPAPQETGAGAGAGAGGDAFPLLPRLSPAPPRHSLTGARTAAAAPEERPGAGQGR